MFTKYKPFIELDKFSLLFSPTRFQIWENEQLNKLSSINTIFDFSNKTENGKNRFVVIYEDTVGLRNELAEYIEFDKFITGSDCFQLITIPSEKGYNTDFGLEALKFMIGATCKERKFKNNEPYCCRLYVQNHKVVKISFNLINKLIEFYDDRTIKYAVDSTDFEDEVFSKTWDSFQKFRNKIIKLPLHHEYKCTVLNSSENVLFESMGGYLKIFSEKIVLIVNNGISITFLSKNNLLFFECTDSLGKRFISNFANIIDFNNLDFTEISLRFNSEVSK